MGKLQLNLSEEEKVNFTTNLFYDIQSQIDTLLNNLEEYSIEDFQTILGRAIDDDNLSMLCFFVGLKEKDLSSYFDEIKVNSE